MVEVRAAQILASFSSLPRCRVAVHWKPLAKEQYFSMVFARVPPHLLRVLQNDVLQRLPPYRADAYWRQLAQEMCSVLASGSAQLLALLLKRSPLHWAADYVEQLALKAYSLVFAPAHAQLLAVLQSNRLPGEQHLQETYLSMALTIALRVDCEHSEKHSSAVASHSLASHR